MIYYSSIVIIIVFNIMIIVNLVLIIVITIVFNIIITNSKLSINIHSSKLMKSNLGKHIMRMYIKWNFSHRIIMCLIIFIIWPNWMKCIILYWFHLLG